jgi:hypothetical protein
MPPAAPRCHPRNSELRSPERSSPADRARIITAGARVNQPAMTGLAPSWRVELVSGVGWIVAGAAIVYGSWTMDRLENLGINPYTAPGLVPGVLGAVIALCGLLMATRAVRTRRVVGVAIASEPILNGRAALALALCLGFGLGLVGHGPPFWIAAAVFIVLSTFLFQLPERRRDGTIWRGLLTAAVIGLAASLVITIVFQEFFLVRLP